MTAAVEVRERPILFSGEMVRAILDSRKTQTRRVVKPQPERRGGLWVFAWDAGCSMDCMPVMPGSATAGACPYGQIGERLWVRETVYIDQMPYDRGRLPKQWPGDLDARSIYYRADGECCDQIPECSCAEVGRPRWRPSIHMPRWASRITLEITDVRVERVQEITEEDAIAEGCLMDPQRPGFPAELPHESGVGDVGWDEAREWYADLWDGLNDARGYGWDANPWVWVIGFRRIEVSS